MSLRTSLKNLIRRDTAASLRERATELRGSLSRRTVVAGTVAAVVPLPAIAAPPVSASPHPDQALLDLDAARVAAEIKLEAAAAAYKIARDAVNHVLISCPTELLAQRSEYQSLVHPLAWSHHRWGHVRFRYIPRSEAISDIEHWQTQAWTGAGLRQAIARAPIAQGRGGLTPFLIRRWKALLPAADVFDTRVEAVSVATGYSRLSHQQDAAIEGHKALIAAIEKSTATTPEGLAVLVRAIRPTPWKDVWGAWPNLLRSAATIAGIDPASLDHEGDSHRPYRT